MNEPETPTNGNGRIGGTVSERRAAGPEGGPTTTGGPANWEASR